MTDARPVVVNLSVKGVDEAADKFDRLTSAIERAVKAFTDLADRPHGGIELKMCGDLVHVDIKPLTPAN